jgi:hypothetical protein
VTRAEQRSRVRTVTAWTAAGAVVLTGALSAKAARSHGAAPPQTSTDQAPAATDQQTQQDPYQLAPPGQPPAASDGAPSAGSGGS